MDNASFNKIHTVFVNLTPFDEQHSFIYHPESTRFNEKNIAEDIVEIALFKIAQKEPNGRECEVEKIEMRDRNTDLIDVKVMPRSVNVYIEYCDDTAEGPQFDLYGTTFSQQLVELTNLIRDFVNEEKVKKDIDVVDIQFLDKIE